MHLEVIVFESPNSGIDIDMHYSPFCVVSMQLVHSNGSSRHWADGWKNNIHT